MDSVVSWAPQDFISHGLNGEQADGILSNGMESISGRRIYIMGTMLRIACRIYLRGVKVRNTLFIFLGRFLSFASLMYIRGSRLPTHNINSRLLYGCPTTFYGGLVWIWLMLMTDALRMSLLVPLMTRITRMFVD